VDGVRPRQAQVQRDLGELRSAREFTELAISRLPDGDVRKERLKLELCSLEQLVQVCRPSAKRPPCDSQPAPRASSHMGAALAAARGAARAGLAGCWPQHCCRPRQSRPPRPPLPLTTLYARDMPRRALR
jgi:hypothetical protein